MLQKSAGAMMLLGTTPPENDISKQPYLHSPNFDIDERSILVGVHLLSSIVFNFDSDRNKCSGEK